MRRGSPPLTEGCSISVLFSEVTWKRVGGSNEIGTFDAGELVQQSENKGHCRNDEANDASRGIGSRCQFLAAARLSV